MWWLRMLILSFAFGGQACAQTGKVYRVAVLNEAGNDRLARVFGGSLARLGYVEGRNLELVLRTSLGDAALLEKHANEIARMNVDVVFTPSTGPAVAMHKVTKSIPIVMGSADPIGAGLVAKLGRPGGNVTGAVYPLIEMAAKRMQMLKEFVPGMTRAAAIWNPYAPTTKEQLASATVAARGLGVAIDPFEARNDAERDRAFAALVKQRPQALILMQDPYLLNTSEALARFVVEQRIPASGPYRRFVDAGGLFSYGVSQDGGFDRAAEIIDRVLKGAKPADIPVTQFDEFELIINERAAAALGIAIPKGLLLRATERIR